LRRQSEVRQSGQRTRVVYLTVLGLYQIQKFQKASALGVTACQPRVLTSVRALSVLTIDNVRYKTLKRDSRF
jgi:hypothetical protein